MEITEREKYQWAVDQQGFAGTFEDWSALSAADREEYEAGARGEGTV